MKTVDIMDNLENQGSIQTFYMSSEIGIRPSAQQMQNKFPSAFFLIISRTGDFPHERLGICWLRNTELSLQMLPGSKVSVNEVEALQVLHARGHLGGHVEEGGEAEGLRVGDHVGSVLGEMRLEELSEVPVLEVLHHDEVRQAGVAQPQHPGDVLVLQPGEELDLLDEVLPLLVVSVAGHVLHHAQPAVHLGLTVGGDEDLGHVDGAVAALRYLVDKLDSTGRDLPEDSSLYLLSQLSQRVGC